MRLFFLIIVKWKKLQDPDPPKVNADPPLTDLHLELILEPDEIMMKILTAHGLR